MELTRVSALPESLIATEDIEEMEVPIGTGLESFLIEYIKTRIKHNQNFLAVIVGPTGSAKSYAAVRLCEALDPTFNIDRVAFSAHEFTMILKGLIEKIAEGKKIAGSAICFDEAGVGLSSRDWYSTQNKIFNAILQTFRRENLIVFFTVPDFSFIDSQARKLFHMIIETNGIIRKRQVARLKPLRISVSKRTGKVYMIYPRFWTKEGILRLNLVEVYKPTLRLRKDYEAKKLYYGHMLIKDAETTLNIQAPLKPQEERLDGEPSKPPNFFTQPLSLWQRKVYEIAKAQPELKTSEIAVKLNLKPERVSAFINQIRRKGWDIPRKFIKFVPIELKQPPVIPPEERGDV